MQIRDDTVKMNLI